MLCNIIICTSTYRPCCQFSLAIFKQLSILRQALYVYRFFHCNYNSLWGENIVKWKTSVRNLILESILLIFNNDFIPWKKLPEPDKYDQGNQQPYLQKIQTTITLIPVEVTENKTMTQNKIRQNSQNILQFFNCDFCDLDQRKKTKRY